MESKGPRDTLRMCRITWIHMFWACLKTLFCLMQPKLLYYESVLELCTHITVDILWTCISVQFGISTFWMVTLFSGFICILSYDTKEKIRYHRLQVFTFGFVQPQVQLLWGEQCFQSTGQMKTCHLGRKWILFKVFVSSICNHSKEASALNNLKGSIQLINYESACLNILYACLVNEFTTSVIAHLCRHIFP